ncbi:class I SAM-dependent methyltransferase [Nocardiopsis ansamitocini]|uniref:Methyltransferase n=1 Tax=Nocardiopsis ansamitocini TaxID=1670832 RepID=A0A9W6UJR9_9ACTN|nr:class I SAM-dependent methyltransferase [Nocardiopsis ansamitocini]GLU49129.1 methyltransferase [Nocardiopsis ansamitocini]
MPFDLSWSHNSHYHPLLLRHVPVGAVRALDVGCGSGRFARRLARHVDQVDAFDASAEMVATARERTPPRLAIHYSVAGLARFVPDPHGYDFIAAIASIHHMPLAESTARLRSMLAPGGVLAVCGLYRSNGIGDTAASVAALIPQWTTGAGLAVGRAVSGVVDPDRAGGPAMPVLDPETTLPRVRAVAAAHLPGARVRRLLFWRYLLTYRAPRSA